MNCVSCDICVYHLWLFVFFPGVFLSSRVTGARPVTPDLVMRVNVRTTTTTISRCESIMNGGNCLIKSSGDRYRCGLVP